MKKKNNFTVTNPPVLFGLNLTLIIFFSVFIIINRIFSGPLHIGIYICSVVIVFIPCSIIMLWTKLFKITVNGDQITVRKGNGFKYSFHVSEIVQVDRKIVATGMGLNEITTIRTASRHFSVETLMKNAGMFVDYILENVDSSKINVIKKF